MNAPVEPAAKSPAASKDPAAIPGKLPSTNEPSTTKGAPKESSGVEPSVSEPVATPKAVAIEVRVDGLELHVQEARAHERRQRVVSVQVLLERAEHFAERVRRWRYIRGVAGPASADPILAAAHLAGQLLGAANAAHESLMRLAQDAHRERQGVRVGELRARVGERVEVVAHLLDVCVGRGALVGALLGLERKQIDEARLRAFDLRREHGFFADECVDEPIPRRDHLPGQLEANEGLLSCTNALGQAGVDDDGGSAGGSACGTKAATSSPPTVVRSYRPVLRLGIVGSARNARLTRCAGWESRRDWCGTLGTNPLLERRASQDCVTRRSRRGGFTLTGIDISATASVESATLEATCGGRITRRSLPRHRLRHLTPSSTRAGRRSRTSDPNNATTTTPRVR